MGPANRPAGWARLTGPPKAMAIAAGFPLPFVPGYRAWSYYAFRGHPSARGFVPGSSAAGEAA